MNRIIHNKNYSGETLINSSVFDSSDYKYGEIVICCDIDNPGLFIYTKGSNGETKIQKVNSINNIFFESNLSSGATGEIVEGDSIYVAVSKIKNEINNILKNEGDYKDLIDRIILTLGIKEDGTFDFWSEYPGLNHVKDAASFAEVIKQLDAAIDSVAGDLAEKIKKEYTDAIGDAIEKALAELKYDFTCESGAVLTAISQDNGKVSVSATTLSVSKDDSGLVYELKLGDDVFGTINIPKDQFLKDASFISAATVEDVAKAITEGQTIEAGKPYIKFEWFIDDVKKPTYVDVSGLVNIYTAKDIEFSDSFSGDTKETGITDKDNVESAIEKIIEKITEIVKEIHENKVSSESGSIIVSGTPDGGTVLDVYIDNDTIVKSDLVSTKGQLSVSLKVDTKTNTEGNIKSEYTLKTSGGTEYGKIYDTRDILSGDSSTFVNIKNERVQVGEGITLNTDKNTISLTICDSIGSVTGPSESDGNGITTAWAVKNFVQAGIYDGDMVMVGRNELLPWENWIGRIHFANGSSHPDDVKYNTVHQAFLITDTNFIELAKAIGFDDDGQYAHHYVQNRYSAYRYFSGATTVMGAIELLDDNIAVEWADQGAKEGYEKKAIRTRETGCDATGYYSFAEGHDTEASGEGSHSEGIETVAEGKGSHAEGNGTTASGENSHTEGSGTSTDENANSAHAEGQNTTANGFASHSEGSNTTAGGHYSHAEGFHTEASGDSSHASGVYTKATNKGETAVGKYNESNEGTVFSVGVGSADNDRKNALEIRGDGAAARAYGEAIITTITQAKSESEIGKLVDSQALKQWIESMDHDDTAVENQYVKEVDQFDGEISVYREGLPVTSIDSTGNTYVQLTTTTTKNNGSQKNSDYHLTITTDVADTKATISGVTTADPKLAGAAGVKEWIESLDYNDTAVENQYVKEVDEADGVISVQREGLPVTGIKSTGDTYVSITTSTAQNSGSKKNSDFTLTVKADVADTKATISGVTTADPKLAGAAGVKEWIESLDYNDTAVSNQYVKEVDETDGVIAVQREGLPVTGIDSTGDTYVSITTSTKQNAGSLKNSDFTLTVKADVADTKAAISGVTTADPKLAGAAGVKAWFESLDYNDTAVSNQYVKEVDETDGVISVQREGLPVTGIKSTGDTYVSITTSTAKNDGSQKNSDFTLTVSADVADTKATISGVTTADPKLAGAAGVKEWFESLDSSSATTNNGYYMTGITIEDGIIKSIGQNSVSNAETKVTVSEGTASTAEQSVVYNITTGGTNGHALTFNRTNKIANATHADAAAKTDKTLTAHYGATGSTDATFNGSQDVTINIPNNTSQLVNGARFVSSVEATTYKISVVTTAPASPANDTIYILV